MINFRRLVAAIIIVGCAALFFGLSALIMHFVLEGLRILFSNPLVATLAPPILVIIVLVGLVYYGLGYEPRPPEDPGM